MTETEISSLPEFDRQPPSPYLHFIRTRQNLHCDKGQDKPQVHQYQKGHTALQRNTYNGATNPVSIDKCGGACVSRVSSTTTAKPRHVAVVTPTSPNISQTAAENWRRLHTT